MSYMSEIDLAKQEGQKITQMKIHTGVLKHICTSCIAMSGKLKNLRHKKQCPNKGKRR